MYMQMPTHKHLNNWCSNATIHKKALWKNTGRNAIWNLTREEEEQNHISDNLFENLHSVKFI